MFEDFSIFSYGKGRSSSRQANAYKSSTLRNRLYKQERALCTYVRVRAPSVPGSADLSLNFRFIVPVQTFRERRSSWDATQRRQTAIHKNNIFRIPLITTLGAACTQPRRQR
ncbi:uncharacterized protein LOC143426099 [Xylocopa sonorina]|uniref:uncharacterized protein LOC143426099 n=1 Tax=Xylocopa sonorina TaxID=1818115 RepID=UPI00403ABD7A